MKVEEESLLPLTCQLDQQPNWEIPRRFMGRNKWALGQSVGH